MFIAFHCLLNKRYPSATYECRTEMPYCCVLGNQGTASRIDAGNTNPSIKIRMFFFFYQFFSL